MPEMNGIEATLEIMKICNKYKKYINIIACSAFESKEEIENCYKVGMKDYVKKPVNF